MSARKTLFKISRVLTVTLVDSDFASLFKLLSQVVKEAISAL